MPPMGARTATAGSLVVEPGNGVGPLPTEVLVRGSPATSSVTAGRQPISVVVVDVMSVDVAAEWFLKIALNHHLSSVSAVDAAPLGHCTFCVSFPLATLFLSCV